MTPPPITPETLDALAELVEARIGNHFAAGRRAELRAKAGPVFAASGCASWELFLSMLRAGSGGTLLEQLIQALTVGETYFFRHPATFHALEREVLPGLRTRNQQTRQLRAWCAGCATGEEAYSLAILLRRSLPEQEGWQTQ